MKIDIKAICNRKSSGRQGRRFSYFFLLCCLATLWPHPATAVGQSAAAFLNVPVGALPAALGNAYSTLGDEYSAVSNPGASATCSSMALTATHSLYLQDTSYEFLGACTPLSVRHNIGLGLAVQYFRPGDVASFDEDGNPAGTFSGHLGAASVSLGMKVADSLAVGLTSKVIDERIADVHASAPAVDLGLVFDAAPTLRMALIQRNIGGSLQFVHQKDPLPLESRWGARWQMRRSITATFDAAYQPRERTADLHLGFEIQSRDGHAFRAGYSTEALRGASAWEGVSVGVGMQLFGQRFDYAFLPAGNLGNTHFVSITFRRSGRDAREPSDVRLHLLEYSDDAFWESAE